MVTDAQGYSFLAFCATAYVSLAVWQFRRNRHLRAAGRALNSLARPGVHDGPHNFGKQGQSEAWREDALGIHSAAAVSAGYLDYPNWANGSESPGVSLVRDCGTDCSNDLEASAPFSFDHCGPSFHDR